MTIGAWPAPTDGDYLACDFCGETQPDDRPWHQTDNDRACDACVRRWNMYPVQGGADER